MKPLSALAVIVGFVITGLWFLGTITNPDPQHAVGWVLIIAAVVIALDTFWENRAVFTTARRQTIVQQ